MAPFSLANTLRLPFRCLIHWGDYFPWIAPITFDLYVVMLSAKQGGTKCYFRVFSMTRLSPCLLDLWWTLYHSTNGPVFNSEKYYSIVYALKMLQLFHLSVRQLLNAFINARMLSSTTHTHTCIHLSLTLHIYIYKISELKMTYGHT